MLDLTPDGLRMVSAVAQRHGVSVDAATAVLGALAQGQGNQAQFNHPDLGGMGQWSQGGMIMVGDMFNQGLKSRVDALCNELAGLLRSQPLMNTGAASFQSQSQSGGVSLFVSGSNAGSSGWPTELGPPASVGAQNDLRYAYFPGPRRLAIQQSGQLRVYDSGEHRISGFSQQQSGDQSLTFTSQFGVVRVADLPLVSPREEPSPPPPPVVADPPRSLPPQTPAFAAPPPPAASMAPSPAAGDVLSTIERLAELRQKNILTEEEFSAKKAELLSRL